MVKYILSKHQIKRLIEGKEVVDGRGRKYIASEDVKRVLRKFDELDVYDKLEVVFESGGIDIREKKVGGVE